MPEEYTDLRTETDRLRSTTSSYLSVAVDTHAVSVTSALEGLALELGISTGRVAIPLTEASVRAQGPRPRTRWSSKLGQAGKAMHRHHRSATSPDFTTQRPAPLVMSCSAPSLTADPGPTGLSFGPVTRP